MGSEATALLIAVRVVGVAAVARLREAAAGDPRRVAAG